MSTPSPETSQLPQFLIRTDKVQRGDVLLTLGSEKKSATIARFSAGQYSHSALCINSVMIFESDGGVIDRKLFKHLGWTTIADSRARLGAVPGNPTEFALYRHPQMSEVSELRFNDVLLEEMSESYGRDYSEMFRLAPLAQTTPAVTRLLDVYYRIEHRLRYAENVPGPFCSELVARFYERLGLPLFSEPKRPEQVSPSDLSRSNLEKVEDAVVQSKGVSIQPSSPELREESPERGDPFALYLNWQRKIERGIDQLDELGTSVESVRLANARLLGLFIEGFDKYAPLVREHVEEASTSTSRFVLSRALRLSNLYVSLATRLPTLMAAYADSRWDVVLTTVRDARHFGRCLLRCNLLLKLHERRGKSCSLSWWRQRRSKRNAWRIVRLTRLDNRNSLEVEDVLLDALMSQREIEALASSK